MTICPLIKETDKRENGIDLSRCWFCGSINGVEIWTNDKLAYLADGSKMPMCDAHSASTRASLKLRELDQSKIADELDHAIGIHTDPSFAKWADPSSIQGKVK